MCTLQLAAGTIDTLGQTTHLTFVRLPWGKQNTTPNTHTHTHTLTKHVDTEDNEA